MMRKNSQIKKRIYQKNIFVQKNNQKNTDIDYKYSMRKKTFQKNKKHALLKTYI